MLENRPLKRGQEWRFFYNWWGTLLIVLVDRWTSLQVLWDFVVTFKLIPEVLQFSRLNRQIKSAERKGLIRGLGSNNQSCQMCENSWCLSGKGLWMMHKHFFFLLYEMQIYTNAEFLTGRVYWLVGKGVHSYRSASCFSLWVDAQVAWFPLWQQHVFKKP